MKSFKPFLYVSALALVIAAFAHADHPRGPMPPELKEKFEAVKANCKAEIGEEHGHKAMHKLRKLSEESPSKLSDACRKAIGELPPPPQFRAE